MWNHLLRGTSWQTRLIFFKHYTITSTICQTNFWHVYWSVCSAASAFSCNQLQTASPLTRVSLYQRCQWRRRRRGDKWRRRNQPAGSQPVNPPLVNRFSDQGNLHEWLPRLAAKLHTENRVPNHKFRLIIDWPTVALLLQLASWPVSDPRSHQT